MLHCDAYILYIIFNYMQPLCLHVVYLFKGFIQLI